MRYRTADLRSFLEKAFSELCDQYVDFPEIEMYFFRPAEKVKSIILKVCRLTSHVES